MLFLNSALASQDDNPSIVVLCYHAFNSKLKSPYSVDSKTFKQQMEYLKNNNYTVIPLSQLVDFLQGKGTVTEKSVVITIDDGYTSVYANAYPILKKYAYPFTMFIYTDFINSAGHDALTWKQLEEMSKNGVDIQCHSKSHAFLTKKPGKIEEKYKEMLIRELKQPKELIEEKLKNPVRFFAYPYGAFDQYVIEIAKETGYEACLTSNNGNNDKSTDCYAINRRIITSNMSIETFSKILETKPLTISDISPAEGEEITEPMPVISAYIKEISDIDIKTLEMIIDKLGKVTPTIDEKTGHICYKPAANLKRGFYFVSILAKTKSEPKQSKKASWLFLKR